MIAFIYPGQGSQHAGMGAAWRQEDSWELVIQASDITGKDVGYLLLEASDSELRETQNAQLATFVTSMVVHNSVKKLGILPNGHAGHSLGEYSALCASGVLDYADAVSLVAARGKAMSAATEKHVGTMSAVIGLDDDTVQNVCADVDNCWIANYNTPGQVVIAGTPEAVQKASDLANEAGAKKIVALSVSGAFHTPLMQSARQDLQRAISDTKFNDADVDVYANFDAKAHRNASEWQELLSKQLTGSVRWSQAISEMIKAQFGIFVEIGPGGTLTSMTKRIDRGAHRFSVAAPDDLDTLMESLCKRANVSDEGEHLHCDERLVISPGIGVFNPDNQVVTGSEIETGTPIGKVGDREVISAFCGEIIEYLAFPGERVQLAQPIAWLRSF